jgi:hypothetical protein
VGRRMRFLVTHLHLLFSGLAIALASACAPVLRHVAQCMLLDVMPTRRVHFLHYSFFLPYHTFVALTCSCQWLILAASALDLLIC